MTPEESLVIHYNTLLKLYNAAGEKLLKQATEIKKREHLLKTDLKKDGNQKESRFNSYVSANSKAGEMVNELERLGMKLRDARKDLAYYGINVPKPKDYLTEFDRRV